MFNVVIVKESMTMKIMAAVDNDNGLMFNNRRQSSDKALYEHIINEIGGNKLWVSMYSRQLFSGYDNLEMSQGIGLAGENDYCFIEDSDIKPYEDKIDTVILYKWNRSYPSDLSFPVDMLKNFKLKSTTDFEGNSHEKITEEVYIRK